MTDDTITKILKLSSGEEIIAKLMEETHPKTFVISHPLKLSCIPRATKQGIEESISLQRWIHFSEDNVYDIPKTQVLVITGASLGLTKFYDHCINRMNAEDESDDLYPTDRQLRSIEEEEDLFDELDDYRITSKLLH